MRLPSPPPLRRRGVELWAVLDLEFSRMVAVMVVVLSPGDGHLGTEGDRAWPTSGGLCLTSPLVGRPCLDSWALCSSTGAAPAVHVWSWNGLERRGVGVGLRYWPPCRRVWRADGTGSREAALSAGCRVLQGTWALAPCPRNGEGDRSPATMNGSGMKSWLTNLALQEASRPKDVLRVPIRAGDKPKSSR